MSTLSPVLTSSPKTPDTNHPASGFEKPLLSPKALCFDSPTAGQSSKRLKMTNLSEGSEYKVLKRENANSDHPETLPMLKRIQTDMKVETSFRAFLSSFVGPERTTKASAPSMMPPPMKKGSQARMTLEQRIERLQYSGLKEEPLTFIHAAYNAAGSTIGLARLGSGTFSDVYSEPANGDSPATVKKVFKEFASTSGTLRPLQGTARLYDLAVACEKQYLQIKEAHNKGLFPVDALPIVNLDSWRQEGCIRQPLVTKMFQPSWDAFVAKINTYGKDAKISEEEEDLLRTIQEVFKRSVELNLCIDFKPDNLGYVKTTEPSAKDRVVIIDTFGLSGSDSSDIIPMHRANMIEFSQGNRIIHDFLTQALNNPKTMQACSL